MRRIGLNFNAAPGLLGGLLALCCSGFMTAHLPQRLMGLAHHLDRQGHGDGSPVADGAGTVHLGRCTRSIRGRACLRWLKCS